MKNLISTVREIAAEPARLTALTRSVLGRSEAAVSGKRARLRVAVAFPAAVRLDLQHSHDHAEIFFQLAGRNEFVTPSERFVQEPEEVVFMPGLTPHRETRIPERGFWCHWVGAFRPEGLACHLTIEHPWSGVRRGIVAAAVIPLENSLLMRELCREVSRSQRPGTAANCLRAVIGLIREQIETELSAQLSLPHQARLLVAQNLSDVQLSVSGLASQLGCHPDSLSREFSRSEGRTLRSYIRQQRLILARELLDKRELGIQEVARLSGYADHSYFTAEFRRAFGSTPSQVRASARERAGARPTIVSQSTLGR